MRKILSTISFVFLVGLALYPSLFSAISIVETQVNRWEMRENLEKASLHSVVITPSDRFTWKANGREIRINGKMFEVASHRYDKGNLIVTGLYDTEENALEEKMAAFSGHQTNKQHTATQGFLLSILYGSVSRVELTDCRAHIPCSVYSTGQDSGLLSRTSDKAYPPPRLS